MYSEAYVEPHVEQPHYIGTSLRKSQKTFIVDVLLGSKYASGVSFTVEKVYRVSLFF